ncbi:hypothetical protein [Janibacter sp. GXQ6167]|uniref:hypothetical protein n=1 Tax=Janibacter sp. GXQ6167 TaxID=3240791 RepID=UPI0035265B8E
MPILAFGAAAPTFAASLRKDPGINGWVRNTPRWQGGCGYTLEVDSTINGVGPDGAPYGLYVYDITDDSVIADPKITYWIIGNQTAAWTNRSGHSSCWEYEGRGASARKADGYIYTPYTWTYNCALDPEDRQTDALGVERLYLGGFHVQASFTQGFNWCRNVTYWTQRFITIDPDGPNSPQPAEELTFERRNGTLGPFRSGARAQRMDVEKTPSTRSAESAAPKLTSEPS